MKMKELIPTRIINKTLRRGPTYTLSQIQSTKLHLKIQQTAQNFTNKTYEVKLPIRY